ncbi:hypothetical protein U1Q18_040054 [Sarracenia purpurea var. burkii]
MLSAAGGEDESSNYATHRRRGFFPSPPSNSSSSSLPLVSLQLHHPAAAAPTMEEVWNDVSLSSLRDRPSSLHPTTTSGGATLRGLTFLDFLSRPLAKTPPPPTVPAVAFASPPSPPLVALTLNSGPDDHFDLLTSNPVGVNPPPMKNSLRRAPPISTASSLNAPFDALASPSSLPELGKKRIPESDLNSGDRRSKRMIKNRESAARSRARKQEYISLLLLCKLPIPYIYTFTLACICIMHRFSSFLHFTGLYK